MLALAIVAVTMMASESEASPARRQGRQSQVLAQQRRRVNRQPQRSAARRSQSVRRRQPSRRQQQAALPRGARQLRRNTNRQRVGRKTGSSRRRNSVRRNGRRVNNRRRNGRTEDEDLGAGNALDMDPEMLAAAKEAGIPEELMEDADGDGRPDWCNWETEMGAWLNFKNMKIWCGENGWEGFGPYGGVPTEEDAEAADGDEAAADAPAEEDYPEDY